jgi:UDPglucose 6-dehydrogenase
MRVAVIGTGYVGLVTGACLADTGHDVICVDAMPERVNAVNQCRPAFHEPGLPEVLQRVVGSGKLHATDDVVSSVKKSQIAILAVGTPSRDGVIDLSFIKTASESIGEGMRQGSGYQVVVVKSTVVPGTADSVVGRIVEQVSGKKIGDFGLCMNPEFLREGTAVDDFKDPDRIVIGQSDERAGQTLAKIYDSFDCPKIFTTLQNAEMTKYTSNALLATLISFSNEIATLCEATPGTDVEQVMDALHLDRRLNWKVGGKRHSPSILSFLRAGCGFGGSCLPKDVTALQMFGRTKGVKVPLLEAVLNINRSRPNALISMAESAVGDLKDKTIAVLGLAFKPGTDDVRDSPALAVIDLLRKKNAVIRGYDPLVSSLSVNGTAITVCRSPNEALSGADAAVITSALSELARWNWDALSEEMHRPVVIDGRSVLRQVNLPARIEYIPIGQMRRRSIRTRA